MSKIGELKGILSASKHDTKRGLNMSEGERRLVTALIAVALLAIALTIVAVTAARSETSISSCKAIILTAQRNSCFAALANSTGNYSICSLVQPQQGSYRCISAFAQSRENVSLCSLIGAGNGEYSSCVTAIASSEGRMGYCLMLAGENESACAYGIASAGMFRNISECNEISNLSKSSACSGIYYNNLAISTRNASYCSMLQNFGGASTLSAILAQNTTGSSLSSELLPYLYFNATPSNFCYYELANLLGTPNLCAYTGTALSQLCYAENLSGSAAGGSGGNYNLTGINVSGVCSSVPAYAQELCTYSFLTEKAVANGNASSCYAINDTGYQYSCILSIATKYSNPSYCDYIIGNSTAQLACKESAAILASNAVSGNAIG